MHKLKMIEFNKLSPIVWHGVLIYKKYNQIKLILKDIDEKLEEFLLVPKTVDNKIYWETNNNLKNINSFSEKEKKIILDNIKNNINKILDYAKDLKSSDNKDKQDISELISLCIEFPDLSYIFVDKNLKPFLAGWGFKNKDNEYETGRIIKLLEEQNHLEENRTKINKKKVIEEENNVNINSKNSKTEKKNKKLLYFLLFFLLTSVLFIMFWLKGYSKGKEMDKNNTTTSPKINIGKYKPIDKSKIKVKPNLPGKPVVITNRAILLLKKNINLKEIEKRIIQINGVEIIYKDEILNIIEIEFNSKESLNKIKSINGIEKITIEKINKGYYVPNDPLLNNKNSSWHLKDVNAYKAWDITMGNPKTVIAVIDGSFDLNHKELKNKAIFKPHNATLGIDKIIAKKAKAKSHGTHVAALALGEGDNNEGSVGLCPKCILMPIELSTGNIDGYPSIAILRGIKYAIDNGADVINLSLGVSYRTNFEKLPFAKKEKIREAIKKTLNTELYKRVFDYAKSKNVIIVYAAGNEDMFTDIDPAKTTSDDVILVSALDKNNTKASFSNFGDNVDISAPGVQIVSAVPNNKYAPKSGTSMSAPIVTGIIGLMKSIKPNINIIEVKKILKQSSKSVNFPTQEHIGNLIDAEKALKLTLKLNKCIKKDNNNDSNQSRTNVMKMPKMPHNLKFTYGLWKSDSPLFSTTDKKSIEVYYYISKNNSYREIKEPNNNCKGNISVTLHNRELNIKSDKARCQHGNIAYSATDVICKPNEFDIVICNSKQLGTNRVAEFKLIKVR